MNRNPPIQLQRNIIGRQSNCSVLFHLVVCCSFIIIFSPFWVLHNKFSKSDISGSVDVLISNDIDSE